MSRLAAWALLLLLLACGCGLNEGPADPTSQSLVELRAGNYDNAIRLASEAIQQSPENAAAYLYRGRAYYYRAGMGDANRAIEDLTEAARHAPESSDVYYTRALVYRDLGQTERADLDEAKARNLDQAAKEVLDALPDSTVPSSLVKAKPAPPADADGARDRAKTAAEMLRENAKDTNPAVPAAGSGGLAGSSEDLVPEAHAPVESEFNKQYRALLGQSTPGERPQIEEKPATDLFGRRIDEDAPAASPLSQATPSAAPLSSDEKESAVPRSPGIWNRGIVAPLQSPFSQRTQPSAMAPTSVPGMLPNVQSPFPKSTRGATGYVPPVSPFGGAGGSASGAAGVSRPFSTPIAPSASQPNTAVRPYYPRDFTP